MRTMIPAITISTTSVLAILVAIKAPPDSWLKVAAAAIARALIFRPKRLEETNTALRCAREAEKYATMATVEKAKQAELRLYEGLPEVTLGELREYYVETGPAYLDIVRLMHHQREKGLSLANQSRPSTIRIVSIGVPTIAGNIAYLKTREWRELNWYSAKRKRFFPSSSDPETQHNYELQKVDGVWKIIKDSYRP